MHTAQCVVHNLAGHIEDPDLRRVAGRAALRRCINGIGVLNEINPKDAAYYRKYMRANGLTWFRRGQVAIVWDADLLQVHACGIRRIMKGGHVGPGGKRVGPNRYMLKWKGHFVGDSKARLMVLGTHLMAKSDTEHKWRRPLFARSVRNAGLYIKRSLKNYPDGFIAGDMNKLKYVDFPFVDEEHVITPPDFGRARYTQVHTFGKLRVTNVQEFTTPSDHDGIEFDAVLP